MPSSEHLHGWPRLGDEIVESVVFEPGPHRPVEPPDGGKMMGTDGLSSIDLDLIESIFNVEILLNYEWNQI